jgi:hypothetical protein
MEVLFWMIGGLKILARPTGTDQVTSKRTYFIAMGLFFDFV